MSIEGSTGNLTASDKESGKAVYGAENKKIGSIDCVMIDKTNGEIAYAVLSFGGFLGIGNDHYRCRGNCSDTTPVLMATAAT